MIDIDSSLICNTMDYGLKLRFEVCLFIIKLSQCLVYVLQLLLKVLSELLTFSQLYVLLCLQCNKPLLLHLQHQLCGISAKVEDLPVALLEPQDTMVQVHGLDKHVAGALPWVHNAGLIAAAPSSPAH